MIEIINKKGTKVLRDGSEILDMAARSINYTDDNPPVQEGITVSEGYEMRPDVVSSVTYGDTEGWDIILKFNGISNPFSLDKNDFLLIPERETFRNYVIDSSVTQDIDIRNQYIEKRTTSVSSAKKTFDQNFKNVINALPPNIAKPGSQEITLTSGSFVFGNDVVNSGENQKSKAQEISDLIKTKLKIENNSNSQIKKDG